MLKICKYDLCYKVFKKCKLICVNPNLSYKFAGEYIERKV